MKIKQIISGCGICLLISVGLHLLLKLIFPAVAAYELFYWLCLAVFGIYCIAVLFVGKKAASSDNIHHFNQLVIASVFVKIVLGLGITILYKLKLQPPDNYFIVPFLQVYLIFTIYETWALMQIGRGQLHKR